jgi:hypothetical protein
MTVLLLGPEQQMLLPQMAALVAQGFITTLAVVIQFLVVGLFMAVVVVVPLTAQQSKRVLEQVYMAALVVRQVLLV